MLNHISIGVASLPNAKAFYDATLSALGSQCRSEEANSIGYGDRTVEFWVLEAEKPVPDERTWGLHICFTAPTREGANRFHTAGLRYRGRSSACAFLRR
jgi:catechol 2,3-dioxygenase-like lactoylglutathione lyase family enzyme